MDINKLDSYEIGPIRPPSEAYSLLLRLTRNCPWNRCLFCHTYKNEKFEIRTVNEIKHDIDSIKNIYQEIEKISQQQGYGGNMRKAASAILSNPPNEFYYNVAVWLYTGGENVFLQDGNSLVLHTDQLLEILKYLKSNFPGIKRITSYARSQSVARKSLDELRQLHDAGLSRLHLGLETGYDPLLKYMQKGVNAAEHIKGGQNVVASGISLSEYVLLGLGGRGMWREHATETARVLSMINPDYIRVRTLTINPYMPLFDEVQNGHFIRLNDEETVIEEKVLIENLNCSASFVSDHTTNLLQELEGKLPDDREKLLAVINRFLALDHSDKLNFEIGRRTGIYSKLDDMNNAALKPRVDDYVNKFIREGEDPNKMIWQLMERFI
jgi:radical SAM superfamily enzyme YgiQ (UPF0313 family)